VSEVIATRRLVSRLLVVVVVMFCFGIFVLPPFYDAMCRVFGINGKTAGAYQGEQMINVAREVRVQFLATNSAGMIWEFGPQADEMVVHPGEVRDMLFVAYNPSDQPMMAQAVPSVSPSRAAAFFHKTECFCFTQQVLQPGERIEMPVRFIVDRDLPQDVKHLTLGYTLFDITARKPPVAQAP
jgi:cytochrome c oxidase assembly protein subunit 11